MNERRDEPGLQRLAVHVWAVFAAAVTLCLLCSGGIVTSKGVGMSVPDWPTTYGYNMFYFPIERWVGGIFYEHTHRLLASGVGLITLLLAVALYVFEPRRWVKTLGLIAFIAVCTQGVLGGLRVTLYKDEIGIFHAMLAQSFLSLLTIIAIVTSPSFIAGRWDVVSADSGLRRWVVLATGLVFLQLAIGATMRHEHAGLSIPDFPKAYGAWLPDTSSTALQAINAQRLADDQVPTNALFIWIQMAHRLVAVVILLTVAGIAAKVWLHPSERRIRLWATVWLSVVVVQASLGAWTIWSKKAADVATSHMALGALTLVAGVVFSFRLLRAADRTREWVPDGTGRFAHTV